VSGASLPGRCSFPGSGQQRSGSNPVAPPVSQSEPWREQAAGRPVLRPSGCRRLPAPPAPARHRTPLRRGTGSNTIG